MIDFCGANLNDDGLTFYHWSVDRYLKHKSAKAVERCLAGEAVVTNALSLHNGLARLSGIVCQSR
jgi:hypothetical protein